MICKMGTPESRKDKPFEDKYHATRRAAFRAAKRDNGIPVSQHPDEIIRPTDNVAYVLDTLLNSLFSFAFMHKKVKNTTAGRKTMALLTKVVEASATPVRSIFELNSYLLLETLLNEKSAVIKLMQDGHNVNHISVFYTNDFHAVAIRNKALTWEQHTRVL